MPDDLRTLAQAVVTLRCEIDALALEANGLTGDDYKAATKRWWEMVRRLQRMNDDLRGDGLCERILAALDAAYAQGYARAMGEVVEQLNSLSDAAVATYQEHRSEYSDGLADGSVEAWQAVRKLAERD